MPTAPSGEHLCILIHSHRPYCFDLNEILALPSGFRYRNRFDMQWIDPTLRQNIESTVGGQVLLILRDLDSNTLIPFRYGKLYNVERVGKVVLFEYHLGDLIAYDNEENVRQQEIVARTKLIGDNHPWLPGVEGEALTSASVFKSTVGKALPTIRADNLTAWGNCVEAVATAPVYFRIEFLKIVALRSSYTESASVRDESFIVLPNSAYELKVFQYVPAPGLEIIPQHSLTINTFPEHVTALRPTLQAVGKYDMLTFRIKTLDLNPGEQTAIEIPHQPDAATTHAVTTSLFLPLRIEETGNERLIAAVLLALISLFFMFRPKIGDLPVDGVRNVATVVFILTVAGPSRTFSAIWPTLPWRFGK